MSSTNKSSTTGEKCFLFLSFLFGVCLCFFIGNFSKRLFLQPDEIRYIGIARSIANGRSITYFHHIVTDYQKILYPLFISIAYKFHDFHQQIAAVALINAVLISSSVFPAYFLAKKCLNSKRMNLFVCIFTILYPEMAMTMTFMSESLYFPMVLWEIFIIQKVYEQKNNRWYLCFFGVFTYALYLCKEVGICFLLGYVLTECFMAWQNKKADKSLVWKVVIPVMSFGILFVAAKTTVFAGMENSYNQTSIEAIMSWKAVFYFFYACIYYLVYVMTSFYIFPILYCTFRWKELSEQTRRIFAFLMITFLVLIGTVGYTISIREDLGSFSPRLHLRYFTPLAVPFFILFLQNYKADGKVFSKRWQKIAAAVFFAVLLIIPNLSQRGLMDSCNMELYRGICIASTKLFGPMLGEVFSFAALKLLWLAVLWIGYCGIKKRPERFLRYFITAVLVLNVVNYALKYAEVRIFYSVDKEAVSEMQELDGYLNNLSGDKMLIGLYLTDQTMELADTYLDDENMYYTFEAAAKDWDNVYPESVPCTWPNTNYSKIGEIEYFVIDNRIDPGKLGVREIIWEGNYFSVWH